MGEHSQSRRSDREPLAPDRAYIELGKRLLENPDLASFLDYVAELAALVVPGARCEIANGADAGGGSVGEIQESVSVPLVVDGTTVASLILYAPGSQGFSNAEIQRALTFTREVVKALTLLLRESNRLALDAQMQEALVTRAMIDQALGILMYTRKCSSREAFEILRQVSQATNRKLSAVAAALIRDLTEHEPEPPRPLTKRCA